MDSGTNMNIVTDKKLLKQKSSKVIEIDVQIKKDMYNMEKVIKKAKDGLGLAAIQIGIKKKIIVVKTNDNIRFYVNPVIERKSKETQIIREGCLSFPGIYGEIERPIEVWVEFMSPGGHPALEGFYGIDAAVMQHEIDHTNGIICVDKFMKRSKK